MTRNIPINDCDGMQCSQNRMSIFKIKAPHNKNVKRLNAVQIFGFQEVNPYSIEKIVQYSLFYVL